MLQKRMPMKNW